MIVHCYSHHMHCFIVRIFRMTPGVDVNYLLHPCAKLVRPFASSLKIALTPDIKSGIEGIDLPVNYNWI